MPKRLDSGDTPLTVSVRWPKGRSMNPDRRPRGEWARSANHVWSVGRREDLSLICHFDRSEIILISCGMGTLGKNKLGNPDYL